MSRLLAVAALLLAVAACGKDQDPGVVPSGSTGPTTTSHLLESCPPRASDAAIPPEGCLGPGGAVVYP